jgi:signal transduction histidine kinase
VIAQKKGGPSVEIRVWDHGNGITKEHQERIFEPLYSNKMDGVGLGLPLCKDIMTRHNGKISLEKTSHEGTVFLIELPS